MKKICRVKYITYAMPKLDICTVKVEQTIQ